MGLFDSTAKRLITGPTLTVPPAATGDVAELIKTYDPGVRVKGDRFGFDNGVLLYGPVDITSELAEKTGLPAGEIAYYARASALPKRRNDRRTRSCWTASGWSAAWRRGWVPPNTPSSRGPRWAWTSRSSSSNRCLPNR